MRPARLLHVGTLLLMLAYTLSATLPGDEAAPRYTVNLDLPPRDRWNATIQKSNATIQKSLDILMKQNIVSEGLKYTSSLFRNEERLAAWFPGEMKEEAEALAELLGKDVSLIAFIALIYDTTASKTIDRDACTGVIVQSSEGGIMHGRTLDYSLKESMTLITSIVDFQKGGETVYSTIHYLGIPASNSLQKPGAFTISHNERDQGSIIENWFDEFVEKRVSTFSAIRQVGEQCSTFDQAVDQLSKVRLSADSYFIVGGVKPSEGAVITRDRNRVYKTWRMGEYPGSKWYVLETNYDIDKAPGRTDKRRDVARRWLDAQGPTNFTVDVMWQLVTDIEYNRTAGERPIYNNGTVFSAVMQASAPGNLKVVVHHGLGPEPPSLPHASASAPAPVECYKLIGSEKCQAQKANPCCNWGRHGCVQEPDSWCK